jgi:5-methylcytosine-specific restriction endonuclease McrA
MQTDDELTEIRRKRRNAKTYRWQKKRRHSRKQQLIDAAGGRCVECGYQGPAAAFEFHHRDPSTKLFSVGDFSGPIGRLLDEIAKCDLLCANCHRRRHAALDALREAHPVVKHRRLRKLRAVTHMGSSCRGCGARGVPAIFEFHHWDAQQKEFGLSVDGIPRTWAKMLAELQKCVMLCANCHREVHAGVRELDQGLRGLAEDALPYVA